MRTSYHQFCAVARTLDAIGSRWTLLIVRELVLRGPLTAAAGSPVAAGDGAPHPEATSSRSV